eukprot:TRINITY_DN1214_c0_g1_i2.p1 TRINITY_DN1214_c0_g1~~TRINITY_DN1214_c0_g1_i2.p1  ORF type:complete len:377 (+),score=66.97 TRINITY_DN1214_c0_g1_i2:85-1215(+)
MVCPETAASYPKPRPEYIPGRALTHHAVQKPAADPQTIPSIQYPSTYTIEHVRKLKKIMRGKNNPTVILNTVVPQKPSARADQQTWYKYPYPVYGTGKEGVKVINMIDQTVSAWLFKDALPDGMTYGMAESFKVFLEASTARHPARGRPKGKARTGGVSKRKRKACSSGGAATVRAEHGKRGPMKCAHLGLWQKYAKEAYWIKGFEQPEAIKVTNDTEPIWRFISDLYQAWNPGCHDYFCSAAEQRFPIAPEGVKDMPFGAFALLVHNWFEEQRGCEWHLDVNDLPDGYCATVCYGDFEGGEVEFPELGIALKLEPGDVLFFKSAMLTHGNAPVTRGIRRSIVLTTHANVIYTGKGPAPEWIDDSDLDTDSEDDYE